MRNLLAILLLVVFTLQATVVAIGEHWAAKDTIGYVVPMPDELSSLHDQTGTTDDDPQLSTNAIEELSDFMPIGLPIPVGGLRVSLFSPSGTVFLSADPQGLNPPPRA